MKSLEITTNKRLLIVELPLYDIIGRPRIFHDTIGWSIQWKYKRGFRPTKLDFNELRQIVNREAKFKFICRGSVLTEDIAAGMADSPDNFQFLDALNTFIGEIAKGGWYWGGNPIEKPDFFDGSYDDNGFGDVDKTRYKEDLLAWQDAESRTFHPEKCLIFEIVD